MEKPIAKILKKADKTTNKITIPKMIIQQWGNEFMMEIYSDKITLTPIEQSKGE